MSIAEIISELPKLSAKERALLRQRLSELKEQDDLQFLDQSAIAQLDMKEPTGAITMLGFARRFRTAPRATADWMNELRAGEHD